MKLRIMRYALLAGGVALSGTAMASGPSGATMAATCYACHGPEGVSQGPTIPTLAGVGEEYFEDVMEGFKSGTRHATVMDRIAKGYSKDQIKAMGKYFSSKKYVGHVQASDSAKVAKGKSLHRSNCEKCHEEGGRLGEEGGILAGQWSPYLTFTMDDFRSGRSEMPKKMASKVKKLSDADIDALMHFYASQK